MTATAFIDTNVLVYAASNAVEDQPKRKIARELLVQPDIGFSAQVLQEFYAAAIAKERLKMTHEEALAVLLSLSTFPVLAITREIVLEAVAARHRHVISYWDAAIITAARLLGCHTVYSEDFNNGQVYDGVTVVNPFSTTIA